MSFEIHVSGAPKAAVEAVVPGLVAEMVATGLTAADSSLWGPEADINSSVRVDIWEPGLEHA